MPPRPITARPLLSWDWQIKAIVALLLAAVAAQPNAARAGDGAAAFQQNCALCHQAGGVGVPGQFPRLAGRVAAISGNPKGRAYLIDVLTYGMSGNITVDGQAIFGLMPPFAQFSDDMVADILSYAQTLGDAPANKPAPFTAAEVTAGRKGDAKSADGVQAERKSLQSAKIIR
jgi:mono/diheme cytochrome c family protein